MSLSSKRHDVSEQKIWNLEVGFNKYAKVTNDRFEELKKVATSRSDDLQKFKDKTTQSLRAIASSGSSTGNASKDNVLSDNGLCTDNTDFTFNTGNCNNLFGQARYAAAV